CGPLGPARLERLALGLDLVMLAAQPLQVVERVIVTAHDVIAVRAVARAPTSGVDPLALTVGPGSDPGYPTLPIPGQACRPGGPGPSRPHGHPRSVVAARARPCRATPGRHAAASWWPERNGERSPLPGFGRARTADVIMPVDNSERKRWRDVRRRQRSPAG